MVKIAILGGGINGLACAVKIKEKFYNYQVTILSSDFSPNTTADGSGGLWYPYLCGNTPAHLVEKWASETFEFFRVLWRTGTLNICLMPIYYLYTENDSFTKPEWANAVYGYMELNDKQLQSLSRRHSSKYVAGMTFMTFVVPTTVFMTYLLKRFTDANGQLLQAKLTSLQDPILNEFDVIINCTGIGARFLVPDEKVVSIRGQIAKVRAAWLNETIIVGSGHYIIPNVDLCILGGTHQDSYSTEVDPKDIEYIMNGCKKLIPGLEHAETVSHWAGLRPGRETVRLEPEIIKGKLCIHNYGHGGSGFTLFWGCSSDVLQILESYLNKKVLQLTSKL